MGSTGHDVAGHWESTADEWIAWARAADHDAFWSYREPFRAFCSPPGTATLEIGCGEGRISRELSDLGHAVTAVELSPTLLAAARDAGSAARYVRADAEALPFTDGAFDRVVSYNVLMDVADMPAAVAEAARVLAPGGTLTISIVHPFADAMLILDGEDYFERRHFTETESRDGLAMHFAGWTRPLQDYAAALRDAGLAITALAEPEPSRPFAPRTARFPLFCWLEAEHRISQATQH